MAKPVPLDPQQQWLVQIAQHRDKLAFAELFRHYAPRLLNHARQHFSSDALAEEMVQETLTKVWLKAHLYHRDKGQVSTWLFTIARNVRFDMLRRQRARPEQLCADEIYLDLESEADAHSDNERLDRPIIEQQLKHYCAQLPPGQRQVVQLIYFDDRSQQEVADALGIPLGTVKSRLRLALAKIRELIDDTH
ncbi:sigma-70 family RNA polymerase sigma factor [Ferrimonas pelagia]|uniref:Sigma-70 family RNA polymerase sigma factor n=1 Tax=Ferrimonas pelagia TaxID=1177826 RepID=A0ABP9FBR6_9GAMM